MAKPFVELAIAKFTNLALVLVSLNLQSANQFSASKLTVFCEGAPESPTVAITQTPIEGSACCDLLLSPSHIIIEAGSPRGFTAFGPLGHFCSFRSRRLLGLRLEFAQRGLSGL